MAVQALTSSGPVDAEAGRGGRLFPCKSRFALVFGTFYYLQAHYAKAELEVKVSDRFGQRSWKHR